MNKTEAQLRRKWTVGFFYLAFAFFFNTAWLQPAFQVHSIS
jgi:hypothetical protein